MVKYHLSSISCKDTSETQVCVMMNKTMEAIVDLDKRNSELIMKFSTYKCCYLK